MNENIKVKVLVRKISVLTSLYRCETFLEDYFIHLSEINGLNQIEILLLHNDPQENEMKIINHWLPKMLFVRHIIIPEREGLYVTWNRGIMLSQGEYVTVWNVDDVRFPNSILQQAEAMDKHPEAAIAYGDIYITETYGKVGTTRTNAPLYNHKKEFFKSHCVSCFPMWRKSIHPAIGYFDEQFKCSADFDFQIRAALHYSFVKVDEPLGCYLEYQSTKLSFNGLQELENNIIYLRYGVYEKVNYFTVRFSLKKYKKNALLFYNEWYPFLEKQPFNLLYKVTHFLRGLMHSMIKQIKTKCIKVVLRGICRVFHQLFSLKRLDAKNKKK